MKFNSTALLTLSLLEMLIAANNAFVIALLHLTYFLLPQLSDFNRTFKQNWTSLLYLTALASTFLKMAFLYSPYAYLLFLMLLYLS